MAFRRRLARTLTGAALLAAMTAASAGVARGATGTATVTVTTESPLATLSSTAFGINTAAWDSNLLDARVPGLVKAAGMQIMRFPGGSTSDFYHWQTNSVTPITSSLVGGVDPCVTFDRFMRVAQQGGAQAMITVNYGSNATGTGGGDPQEAAGWVRYANKGGPGYTGPVPDYPSSPNCPDNASLASATGHTYGITYWEIGNEVYGNGTYGAHWEVDQHPITGPVAYGENASQFIDAMKAVDPSIKVGVVLTAPGNWPDGDVGPRPDWNSNVLTTTCARLDFVDVHWYPQDPGPESDATLLGSPEHGNPGRSPSIPAMVSRLRAEINQYCPARAGSIGIMVTETNSVSYNPGKQTVSLVNALYLPDDYLTWLENGVANVDWWTLHNSINTTGNVTTTLYGSANYGDYGVLSRGQSANGASEPPAETPFPPYYGLRMVGMFGAAGGQLVSASSSAGLIAAHAVKRPDGSLAVLLINKDPANSYDVTLSLPDYAPAPTRTVYSYGMGSDAISSTTGQSSSGVTVPPYSLTMLEFTPGNPGGLGAPTPELGSGELLAMGLAPALLLAFRARRKRRRPVAR